jgi:hypothetical protein
VPLVAGEYALRWLTPASDFKEPRPFIIMGDPSDALQVEFEAMLDTVAIDVGDAYACLIGTCGRSFTTQHRLVPHLTARPLQQPSISDVAQFLFRVKTNGSQGGWRSFDGGSIDLSVQFDGAQDEYCLAVEAMRVSDAEIMQLGDHCADDTLGDLGTRPTPYDACPGEEDEPEFLAVRETYRKAWCSDNAKACTQHADAYDDACSDYAVVCDKGNTRADVGVSETSADADAGAESERDARHDDRASSSCAVHAARARTALLAGWFACAAAWLMRRRASPG